MADFISPGIIGNPMNPYQQSYSDTCAIKSQQLILSDFGIPITEDQLVQYSMDQGWYTGDGSGTHLSDVGKLLADAGIPCTQSVDANIYDLVDELVVYQLPFSAGQGIPVLNTFRPQHWELHKTTSFSNGICRLIYRKSCKM